MTSVPKTTELILIACVVLGVLIPVLGCVYLKKVKGASLKSFFVGCGIMLVFALVLERLFHSFVFSTSFGEVIRNNSVLYALYGGLAAAVFEETGRLLAFKYILKKERDNDFNSLMYGVGHGGLEMFLILSIGMVNNLIIVFAVNGGRADSLTAGLTGESLAAVEAAIQELCTASPTVFLWTLLERLSAMAAQISLSVLVWFAVKRGGKNIWLYVLAMGLHLLLDSYAVISGGWNVSANTIELMVLMLAFGYVLLAKGIWPQPDTLPEE